MPISCHSFLLHPSVSPSISPPVHPSICPFVHPSNKQTFTARHLHGLLWSRRLHEIAQTGSCPRRADSPWRWSLAGGPSYHWWGRHLRTQPHTGPLQASVSTSCTVCLVYAVTEHLLRGFRTLQGFMPATFPERISSPPSTSPWQSSHPSRPSSEVVSSGSPPGLDHTNQKWSLRACRPCQCRSGGGATCPRSVLAFPASPIQLGCVQLAKPLALHREPSSTGTLSGRWSYEGIRPFHQKSVIWGFKHLISCLDSSAKMLQ